jgi:hypothetical protein
MTEIAAEAPVETPEVETTEESPKANKEARYRVERNTAREELATVTARIDALNRSEIARLAGNHLSVGEDLFINGNETADYLTESGEVDAEKVAADAAVLRAERPGLGKIPRGYDPSQGTGGNGPVKQTPGWGSLLQG